MAKTLQSPGSFLAIMLEKYKLNPFKLSKEIHLSQSAVRLIAIGKTKISTPVAMRLAKYFNTNPEFWLSMQMKWDIAEASKDKALAKIIKNISRVTKAPAGGVGKKSVTKKKPRLKKKATAKKAPAKKTTAKKTAVRKPRLQKKPVAKKPRLQKTVRARKKTTVARRRHPVKK